MKIFVSWWEKAFSHFRMTKSINQSKRHLWKNYRRNWRIKKAGKSDFSVFCFILRRKTEGFSCDQNLEEIIFADITLLRYFVRNDIQPVIARRSRSDPDRIQTSLIVIWIAKQPLCGYCFTVIRNSRGDSKSPSVSLCSLAPLAGSENYNDLFSPLRGGDVRRTEGVGTKVSLK